jgi:hypothetical protein
MSTRPKKQIYPLIICKHLASAGRLRQSDWVTPSNLATATAVIPNSRSAQ